ncbi:MAG: lysophospholipid acyltransferase family protein [Acidobacteriota bacterium]|nr:lysophospholipid acyltransferase family protein [Acidobacteriota bacterium]
MIRLLFCVFCWVTMALVAAVGGFPALYITGRVDALYGLSLWAARTGCRLAGLRVTVFGREQLDPAKAYLFMANHTSNLDPPLITPELPRRVSIMAKQELFRIPLFGRAMRAGEFIAVNRKNRSAAIDSVRQAVRTLQSGLGMMVFPEGTRSRDGRLLPFKKGPFHLAMEASVPVVPITIVGTHDAWPKGGLRLRKVPLEIHFHPPLDPRQFASRDELLLAVRKAINSKLPDRYRE